MSEEGKVRSSNLELLRIVSMLLIIICHSSTHGGFALAEQVLSANKLFLQLITFGGELGVCCFILITGYFMINSTFKIKKLLKLVFEVLFYSVGIMLIFYGFGLAEFNLTTLVKSLLPITHTLYWFVTAYVMLYILSPFINILLKNCSRKMHAVFILVLFSAGSLVPSLTLGNMYVNNLGLFICFYAIAAYIRMYPDACASWFKKTKENFLAFAGIFLLFAASVLTFDLIGNYIELVARNATHFIALSSPLIILGGVCLFLGFKNLKIPSSKFINQVALSVFGVYLIHDNPFVRTWLWHDVFRNAMWFESPYLVLIILGMGVVVFCGCVVIDQVRIRVVERPLFAWIDRVEERMRGKEGC